MRGSFTALQTSLARGIVPTLVGSSSQLPLLRAHWIGLLWRAYFARTNPRFALLVLCPVVVPRLSLGQSPGTFLWSPVCQERYHQTSRTYYSTSFAPN